MSAIDAALDAVEAKGFKALAITLMHAYAYPEHEAKIAARARARGTIPQVSVSHEASPLVKLVGRGDTTVVDAYLSPILKRYVNQVAEELGVEGTGCRLMFMMSSGGLTAADMFEGKDAILSGPAGGVVGAVQTAQMAGFDKIIGFDMGGTSTDVSHYNGTYERAFDTEVAGVRIRAPMMRIHTVAAGGGSILHYGWPLSGRAGLGGRQPRPGLLSPRRPARRDRRQRDGRQAATGLLPVDLRPRSGSAA
jgi:5-oxoprolinase (ATP-hydrolysing)